MIRSIIVSLLFLTYITLSVAQCNSTDAARSPPFAVGCPDIKAPYCRGVQGDNASHIIYECRECNTNCDCDYNEYCSIDPTKRGTCVKFQKSGKECRLLDNTQIRNMSYPDEWKCADLYQTFDEVNQPVLNIDYQGQCVEGKCQFCTLTYRCNPGQGLKGERLCTNGKFHDARLVGWTAGSFLYQNFPGLTWWPVMFAVLILVLIVQSCLLCFKLKGGKSGEKKEKKPKEEKKEEKHESEKQQETQESKHSTQSPQDPPAYSE